MVMSMTSTSVSVTISGGITVNPFISQPNVDQTVRHSTITLTGAANKLTALTVTAGKTFYLMGFVIYNNSGAAGFATIYENDGTTVVMSAGGVQYAAPVVASNCPLHVYTTEQIVKIAGHTGLIASVWGHEI